LISHFDEFSPAVHGEGVLTVRLSCVREETGQTDRRKQSEPIWTRTQQAFPKSRDSTVVSPALISETPVQRGKKRLGGESVFRIATVYPQGRGSQVVQSLFRLVHFFVLSGLRFNPAVLLVFLRQDESA